jgi:hypothetical protein
MVLVALFFAALAIETTRASEGPDVPKLARSGSR